MVYKAQVIKKNDIGNVIMSDVKHIYKVADLNDRDT